MTRLELYKTADFYKERIKEYRPFKAETQKKVDDYFCSELNRNISAFDNNTINIKEAYDYILLQSRGEEPLITEDIIRRLHDLISTKSDEKETGYRQIPVSITGVKYLPPSPEEIPHLMNHFISQMGYSKQLMHPIEYAAMCHKRFMDIQPFQYGNCAIAILLMNLYLINTGYGAAIIPKERLDEYYNALDAFHKQNPDIDTFIELILECVIETEKVYCRFLGIEAN